MKKILMGLCLLFFAASMQAQTADTLRKIDKSKFRLMYHVSQKLYNDSIYIFSSGLLITLKTRDLAWLIESELQLNTLIEDFQRVYSAQRNHLPPMNHYKLSYSYYFQSIIKEELDTTAAYYYQLSSNTIKRIVDWNECHILSPGVKIEMKFMNDSVLLDPRLPQLVNKILSMKTQKEWNKLSVAWVNNVDSSGKFSPYNENITQRFTYTENKATPSVDLHMSTGLSFIKTAPALQAEVKLAYTWDNAGYKTSYCLSYDWNFSFDENDTRSINSFVNLSGLEDKFLTKLKTMAGIDMGYLVFRQGDLYEKNTFRLGFGFKGDFWYFSPQMYFPGKFKGVYPGLRVLIGI